MTFDVASEVRNYYTLRIAISECHTLHRRSTYKNLTPDRSHTYRIWRDAVRGRTVHPVAQAHALTTRLTAWTGQIKFFDGAFRRRSKMCRYKVMENDESSQDLVNRPMAIGSESWRFYESSTNTVYIFRPLRYLLSIYLFCGYTEEK